MKNNNLVEYLKIHTLREINEMYEWHKGKPDYEPYWKDLLSDIKEVIQSLDMEAAK